MRPPRLVAAPVSLLVAFLFLFAAHVVSLAAAQEWTRFRGPNGAGIAEPAAIPAQWTEKDYNWKVELPGIGHSSPVLWGDKIFVTSGIEANAARIVSCLKASDGSVLWRREFPSTPHKKHNFNCYASASPAVDENRVYLLWTTPEEYTLMALDHEGKDAWRRSLGPFVSQHSGGSSPVVFEDLVIVNNDQDGASSLIAVDRATGEPRWKTDRRTEAVSYSTPCVYRPDGQPAELLFNSWAHGITSIDPKTGKVNWEAAGVFKLRTVSSPVVAAGLVFGSCGSGGGGNYVVAVRPGNAQGRAAELAYKITASAPYVPTSVAKGDLLFLWSDKGIATCIKAATGDKVWQKRVGGDFFGSPVRVGDRLYAISLDGEVVVLAASENYELLGRNPLGESSRATPAVAGGVMYLRTYSHLVSIGGKKETK